MCWWRTLVYDLLYIKAQSLRKTTIMKMRKYREYWKVHQVVKVLSAGLMWQCRIWQDHGSMLSRQLSGDDYPNPNLVLRPTKPVAMPSHHHTECVQVSTKTVVCNKIVSALIFGLLMHKDEDSSHNIILKSIKFNWVSPQVGYCISTSSNNWIFQHI